MGRWDGSPLERVGRWFSCQFCAGQERCKMELACEGDLIWVPAAGPFSGWAFGIGRIRGF